MALHEKAKNTVHSIAELFNEIGVGLTDKNSNEDEFESNMILLLTYIRGLNQAIDIINKHPQVLLLESEYGTSIDEVYKKHNPYGIMQLVQSNPENTAKYRKDGPVH